MHVVKEIGGVINEGGRGGGICGDEGRVRRMVPLFDASGILYKPWKLVSSCPHQEDPLRCFQALDHPRHHLRRLEARCEAQWA